MENKWVELQKRPLWVLEHLGSNCWNLEKSLNVIYRGGGSPFYWARALGPLGPLALPALGAPSGLLISHFPVVFQVALRVSWELFRSYPALSGPAEAFVANLQRHRCSTPFAVAYQDSKKPRPPDLSLELTRKLWDVVPRLLLTRWNMSPASDMAFDCW